MRDAPDENQHCHVPRSTFNFALGPFNPIIALLIATIKATLVVLFFIHVKSASEKLTGAVVVSGFFFLAILLTQSLADYLTRSWR